MTIERKELGSKEEENEKVDYQAKWAEAQAARESAEKEATEAKIAAAKASGEAEALKLGLNKPADQPQWTDEQWENEAQKHGMTGQMLKSQVAISKSIVDVSTKELREKAEAASREAREAKEENKRLRDRNSLTSLEQDFYEKKPALRMHKSHIDEFLSSYPDKDTVDGKTLAKRLELAENFVKGKVKDNMRPNKSNDSGSMRLETNEENREPGDIGEFDPKGTGNEGAAYVMSRVHSDFGKNLRHQDSVEVWKKSLDDEGRGVAISMDEDMQRYNEMKDRDFVRGGK